MAQEIHRKDAGVDSDRTQIDPNSPLHRGRDVAASANGAPDNDKTQIDPNSPLHRGRGVAASANSAPDNDKTQIDRNSPLHRGSSAPADDKTQIAPNLPRPQPAAGVDADKTRMLLQDVGRMLVADGAPVDKTRALLGSVRDLVITRAATAAEGPDKTQALLGDVRALLKTEGVAVDEEKTRMLLKGIAELVRPQAAATGAASAPLPDLAPPAARSANQTRKTQAQSITLPVGYRLFEYRTDAVLGQGGFGITYLATDVNLNVKVAIKEYLPEDIAYRAKDSSVAAKSAEFVEYYEQGRDDFLVEARTLATFRHRNIVRVARFFEANTTAYMVLEYERGKSLTSWWKDRKNVSERDLLTLLLPLLDGLGAVHEAGYLHRDIKPDNIYVRDDDGSLVLLDFGAARQTGARDEVSIVTPGYGPIEQYLGGDQGPWTDIYALGATLYWMIAGKKPMEATQRTGDTDPLPPAVEIGKGRFSEEFLKAVDWALKPDAKDRPQDMPQFLEALYAAHASTLGLQQALREREGRAPVGMRARLVGVGRKLLRPGSWPLAAKMTLAMVATALAPMLITAYYNLQGSVERVSRSELGNLEQLAASLSGRVAQLATDSKNLAVFLASDDEFVKFLARPTDAQKPVLKAKLDNLVKSNPDVQLAMVFDTDGNAVVSSDPAVMGRNFKFREYFKVAMEGKPFVSGIIVGAVAGASGVFYSIPVFGAEGTGKPIGAVVLRIKAEAIARILDAAKQGNERIPFLIDDDGVIIHHPNPKLLYTSLAPLSKAQIDEIAADQRFRKTTIDSVNMPTLAKAMIQAKEVGSLDYKSTITGKDEIVGYAPVRAQNWTVGVTESREYFEAPLNDLFQTVLYSVVVVGAVFLLLALLFARSIVRPIRQLTDAAHALKSADYDKASVVVKSDDEIGQLQRTFNVMIDVLRQRERERGSLGRRGGTHKG